MELRKSGMVMCAVLMSSLFLPGISLADPVVDNIFVTDVTTRSFSVIWTSNEASTPSLEVYGSSDGSGGLVGDYTSTPVRCNTSLQTVAENLGAMKVQVTGLAANTTYYFKTITDSATGQTVNPDVVDPLLEVTTATLTVRTDASNNPISNDIIISDWTMADASAADGTIVFSSVTGAAYPMTSFVGDCAPSGSALVDLNNMFNRSTGQNLDLSQGVNLNLVNFRGTDGTTQIVHEVPQDNLLAEVKNADPGLKSGWNMASFQLDPNITDIADVISSIDNSVDAIWGYNASTGSWQSIDVSVPSFLWDLNDLYSLSGYWFVMNSDASLKVNGDFISSTKQLAPGWNLVGAKSFETIDLTAAIAPISDKIDAVWSFNISENKWYSYDKNIPPFLNDLFTLQPGRAYWFVMNSQCIDADCKW